MQPSQARFVTVCQQLLALGVVLAILTPAAGVISLDVVARPPVGSAAGTAAVPMAAYARAATVPSVVPTAAVDPKVKEYSLTAPAGARIAPGALMARSVIKPSGASEVTSRPLPVTGYGAVGVTWQPGTTYADDAITVEARTYDGATWSDWTTIEYHDDHGPDPDSDEGVRARPGTDPLLVGDVDEVQVRVATDRGAPADLKLAVIDPGHADAHRPRAAGDRHRRTRRGRTPRSRRSPSATTTPTASRWPRRRTPRSRRSTRGPSGAPTRACATRARCTTSRCTPASCTTP